MHLKMIDLLTNDLPSHYGLHRSTFCIISKKTNLEQFDLTENEDTIVVPYKNGNVSFDHANQTEIEIINYEKYLNSLSGTAFERGRKRCDLILYEKGGNANSFFLLNEQTTTLSPATTLSKPILDKDKNVVYPKGKYEKVEEQLLETLQTLKGVSSIASFINKYQRKVALMSYQIIPKSTSAAAYTRTAFADRYKKVEAQETGEEGALLPHERLNVEGFEYRRISHEYSFRLS